MQARTAAAAVASFLLGACSAAVGPSPNPSGTSPNQTVASPSPAPAPAGTITLTDSGCDFEQASESIEVGPIILRFVNETSDVGAFHLWQLDDGRTFEDFAAFIAEHRRAFDEGLPDTGPPPFATQVGEEVRTDATATMAVTASEATYGVACITPHEGAGRLVATYAAGPIVVGSPTAGPPARGYHPMSTLGEGRGVLLFGGSTAPPPEGGTWLFDTWSFSASNGWRASTATPPGLGGNLAFDSQSDRVISLANVGRDQFDKAAQTWAYDPAADAWLQMTPASIPGSGGEMAYDRESDRVLLFAEETWAYDFDANTWAQRQSRPRPSGWFRVTYDSQSDRVILFGGEGRNDTWAYDDDTDTWTELTPEVSPPARHYHAMEYEPTTDRVILFGGVHGPFLAEVPFDDTWAYDYESNTWTELKPATAPSARGWHAMAYSALDRTIVLFGGGQNRSAYGTDTWLFDPVTGEWQEWRTP